MEDLLQDIEKGLAGGLYYVALVSTLAIPDMAGRLEGIEGGVGLRYQTWFERNLPEYQAGPNPFSGRDCYKFRCSLVHQGTTQDITTGYKRVVFLEPNHMMVGHRTIMRDAPEIGSEKIFILMLVTFVQDMINAARRWLASVQRTEPFESNYRIFARRHPQGMERWIAGVPMFG